MLNFVVFYVKGCPNVRFKTILIKMLGFNVKNGQNWVLM